MGLALGIALVSRWHEWQWQVPKALARILLGCSAVGIFLDESLFVSGAQPQFYLSFFKSTLYKEMISCPRGET